MKKNIRDYIIVFFIALLGAMLGTFSVLQFGSGLSSSGVTTNDVVVNKVEYNKTDTSDYTKMIQTAYDTVVSIKVTSQSSSSSYFFDNSTTTALGSGVIISEDGYIVTNNHVASGATTITVTTSDGTEYEATTIGLDEKTDLALIKIEATGLNYSSFVSLDDVSIGDDVVAIGNANGQGITVTKGIISSLSKEYYSTTAYMDVIQTDAAINEGNSGGGLFNMNGDLVGIVNSKTMYTSDGSTVEGMGYAIPCDIVTNVISDLMQYGYVKNRATLGITAYQSTYQYYYYGNVSGVVVTSVTEGGGAANAGMEKGDIIVKIDDNEVTSYSELNKVLYGYSVGDTVEVSFYRNGQLMSTNVTLQEASK